MSPLTCQLNQRKPQLVSKIEAGSFYISSQIQICSSHFVYKYAFLCLHKSTGLIIFKRVTIWQRQSLTHNFKIMQSINLFLILIFQIINNYGRHSSGMYSFHLPFSRISNFPHWGSPISRPFTLIGKKASCWQ